MALEDKIVYVKIIPRIGTSSEWTANNIILLAGEFGIETDTGKLKLGNGVSHWNDLVYYGQGTIMPSGGSTGQVLTKASNANFDYSWQAVGASSGVSSVNGETGAIINVSKTNLDNQFSASQTITGTGDVLTIRKSGVVGKSVVGAGSYYAEDAQDNCLYMTPRQIDFEVDGDIFTIQFPHAGGRVALDTQVVPVGGTVGQALIKNSATDYDTSWGTVSADMSKAQILSKLGLTEADLTFLTSLKTMTTLGASTIDFNANVTVDSLNTTV